MPDVATVGSAGKDPRRHCGRELKARVRHGSWPRLEASSRCAGQRDHSAPQRRSRRSRRGIPAHPFRCRCPVLRFGPDRAAAKSVRWVRAARIVAAKAGGWLQSPSMQLTVNAAVLQLPSLSIAMCDIRYIMSQTLLYGDPLPLLADGTVGTPDPNALDSANEAPRGRPVGTWMSHCSGRAFSASLKRPRTKGLSSS